MQDRNDTLIWPLDRQLLLGFAPAGLSAGATLLVGWLLDRACPEAQPKIVAAMLVGQAALWLVFAPIYLLGWVHHHPRRAVDETGWSGSAALAGLMWLLNILVFGAVMAAIGWADQARWDLLSAWR